MYSCNDDTTNPDTSAWLTEETYLSPKVAKSLYARLRSFCTVFIGYKACLVCSTSASPQAKMSDTERLFPSVAKVEYIMK